MNFIIILEYTGWVADALRLIAVSKSGLSQFEILDILRHLGYTGDQEVHVFDWALFRSAAQDALHERPGGLYSFFHQHFKDAVQYTLLGESLIILVGILESWLIFAECLPLRQRFQIEISQKLLIQFE